MALLIDDLVSANPWTAVAVENVDPPVPAMSREAIRITPTWVASWGPDPQAPGMAIRR